MNEELETKVIDMLYGECDITFVGDEAASITTLDLSGSDLNDHLLTEDNSLRLIDILSKMVNLEKINLDCNGVRDEMASWLNVMAKCNLANLREITWDYAPRLSNEEDALDLCASIAMHPNLRIIKFGSSLGTESALNMSTAFKKISAFGKAKKPGHLNSLQWYYLSNAIKKCTNLTSLDLTFMYVGFWAEKAIVSILSSRSVCKIEEIKYKYSYEEDPATHQGGGEFITNAFEVKKSRERLISLLSARKHLEYNPAIMRLPSELIRLVAITTGVPSLKKIEVPKFKV